MNTYAYGFPRIGLKREYKRIVESFFHGTIEQEHLDNELASLQQQITREYGAFVDSYPSGEMTRYDTMLDTAVMLGVYSPANAVEYYRLCRGDTALPMTKWFNTNYHYLVPDLSDWSPRRATANTEPLLAPPQNNAPENVHLIGPVTFLRLSVGWHHENVAALLPEIARLYRTLLAGIDSVYLDEPALAMDTPKEMLPAIREAYTIIGSPDLSVRLMTYYDSVDFLPWLYDLPLAAIGLDFVHGTGNRDLVLREGFPPDKELIAGVVDGKNVWRTDDVKAVSLLRELAERAPRLSISNAAPLFHLPVTLEGEQLEPALMERLAFARERLAEIRHIAALFQGHAQPRPPLSPGYGIDPLVRQRTDALTARDFTRNAGYRERLALHHQSLALPLFPTTTIGSFPQTSQVRKQRAALRKGKITEQDFCRFIDTQMDELIAYQERQGLDVLVHGEYERTDMVEFFAEKLRGIATTHNGWIISYGTRGYRPPIIYGDISRPEPMTVREIAHAQQKSTKPVKGMLTGPITIVAWAYSRGDLPEKDVAVQLARIMHEC